MSVKNWYLAARMMKPLTRVDPVDPCYGVAIFTSHMNVDMPLRSPQALVSRCIASFDKVGSIPAIAPSALQGQSAGIRRSGACEAQDPGEGRGFAGGIGRLEQSSKGLPAKPHAS